jgi:hypothetical protein
MTSSRIPCAMPVLIALSIMVSAHAQAERRAPVIAFGNWTGGPYTNDTNGAFSHCAVGANYGDGVRLMVSVNQQLAGTIGLAHQDWQLPVGQVTPVDLTFDGRGPFQVFAKNVAPALVAIAMPENSRLMGLFGEAAQMTMSMQGTLFSFKLANASEVMPALVDCVRQNTGGASGQ